MKLVFLKENEANEALQLVLSAPYDNAVMIAHLTALKGNSRLLCARDRTGIKGLLALHTGLSLPAVATWCEDAGLFRALLRVMAARHPALRHGPAWCLADERSLGLLEKTVEVTSATEELQMKLDLASYQTNGEDGKSRKTVPLMAENLPDLNALYKVVPPEVWRPEEIERGPYRGIYDGKMLVAAAGVHWISSWIAEIGNVAVLPGFRRRGLAEACVEAVIEDLKKLSQRTYLMVFADNDPAIRLYRKMGFEEVQRMWLVEFRLPARGRVRRATAVPAPELAPR